jgi:hypothetical protein
LKIFQVAEEITLKGEILQRLSPEMGKNTGPKPSQGRLHEKIQSEYSSICLSHKRAFAGDNFGPYSLVERRCRRPV